VDSKIEKLEGLAVLRWSPANFLEQCLQEVFCIEFQRLEALDVSIRVWFESTCTTGDSADELMEV
jgi:hypothetical protein